MDILKSRVCFFRKYGVTNNRYKVKDLGEIYSVECMLPEDCEFERLKILISFPQKKIELKVITDDESFYESFFYKEIFIKRKYEEVWKKICESFKESLWIEKMIQFVECPNTVMLWESI